MSKTIPKSPLLVTPAQRKRSRIAEIISEVETSGPNIAEVARRLRKPKESVTYTYRTNIEKNGYRLQARADREALGLRDVAAIVDIAPEYAPRAGEIFDHADKWYLNGFNMTLPDGKFWLSFTLPEENYDEFPRLLERMKKVGLLTKVHQTYHFDTRRHKALRAELFDFKRGRWEFDWSQLREEPVPEIRPRTPRQKLDLIDIQLLGFFFINAAWPINDIAKKLEVSSKTAYRHAQHIEERHLVQSYGVNWLKTYMQDDLAKPFTPKHKFNFTHVNVQGVSPEELRRISEKMNLLPFLWMEYTGEDYTAELAVPLEQMVETMSYLRDVLEPVAERSNTYMSDPGSSRAYTPPWKVFDASKGDWVFDLDSQMESLEHWMKSALKENPSRK